MYLPINSRKENKNKINPNNGKGRLIKIIAYIVEIKKERSPQISTKKQKQSPSPKHQRQKKKQALVLFKDNQRDYVEQSGK